MKFRITKERDCMGEDWNYWVSPSNPIINFIVRFVFMFFPLGWRTEEVFKCKSSKKEALEHIRKYNSGHFKSERIKGRFV